MRRQSRDRAGFSTPLPQWYGGSTGQAHVWVFTTAGDMYETWINSGGVPTTGDRFFVGNVFSLSPVQVQGTSMSDVKSTYRGK